MTLGKCIYTLLLMPLQILFEVVYDYAKSFVGHPGLAIAALSLAINILVLPLYRRADAMQEAQRDMEEKLHNGVAHIRKTFRGDERTMMLQTYYRQNQYSPLSALRGATSLLLEIPFFIAAYRFLSGLEILNGVSFGPIADLSQPDGLLVIGGLTINLLPIIMTAVNIVSSAIFTKNYPLKTKIQLYVMAGFFLVFLYDSPSGLVFYWTLNNLFSLAKTIFYKIKHQQLVLSLALFAAGCCVFAYISSRISAVGLKKTVFFFGIGILLCLPLVYYILQKTRNFSLPTIQKEADKRIFLIGALFLTVLIGLLIPSSVIHSSPQEFVDLNYFVHPIWYIVSSFFIALGTFVLWLGVFYWLSAPRIRVLFDWCVWIACCVTIVDYLFFGTHLGNLSSDLQYDLSLFFSEKEQILNLLVIAVIAVLSFVAIYLKPMIIRRILPIAVIAMLGMSSANLVGIGKSISQIDLSSRGDEPYFSLSKTGKNVVIIMLDRAMGEYIPFLFQEKPEMEEKFDGFTYYSNVISFGGHTNFATAPLFGGYEYTPIEMNKRENETLCDKQNEALKMLPKLFSESGFDVTVCDPPYAGYQWISDLSIYDDLSGVNTFITEGCFTTGEIKESQIAKRFRNFFCFGFMKTMPSIIQGTLYQSGNYRSPYTKYGGGQIIENQHKAQGINESFCNSYCVLQNLSKMTEIENGTKGSLLMLCNNSTHNSVLFSEPDYCLSVDVDNTSYDEDNSLRFVLGEKNLRVDTVSEYGAYQVNMASLLELSDWFDFLRENEIYDNTRIILVSDHGFAYNQMEEFLLDDTAFASDVDERYGDAEFYYPLLMVKDYDEHGFSTSNEFMTNADVPTIATTQLFDNPINPYSDNPITDAEKNEHEQYIIASSEYDPDTNNGNQYHSARWYSIHDDIWIKDNWALVAEDAILP